RPLGDRGFQWLKLHCINLTGKMKRDSIADRLKEADRLLDEMVDSANHPLDGILPFLSVTNVIKQTVMTTVYGVTLYGAALQIKRQLKALDIDNDDVGNNVVIDLE
ncbi:hypothetical protein ANCCEY_15269, partial [Ancylostoma ceylanicum]